ncbi:MAG TPA: flagellar basal-body MS-ring/collar protein FliF [Acidimicrobiales bacterium]|nr:flagellar basal-body MS-ring/collar protein FliF [Acidimicrobiales bacterium]
MALVPANQLTQMREGVQRFSSGFTIGQKVVTAIAVVAVIAGAGLFMSLAGKPTYVPLFTNLAPADASSLTQMLTSAHVPYQLENGGTVILVPQNDVDQERLAAAQAGLPAQSTVGLSILDKEGLTTSQLTQQADYLRALQGELEQTIDAISGVTSSQVNIALTANQALALGNQNPSGASVLVALQPGHVLTSGQVQAIVHLVSSSVPGLDAGQVTVADSAGNLLAGPGVQAGANGGDSAGYDAAQQAKIEAYLASVLGPSNADVQVNATLNYDQVKTSSQSITTGADGKPVSFCTNTQQSSTTASGAGAAAGGAAGTVTAPAGSSNGSYTQTQNNQTCEASQQSQVVTKSPGTVTQQSVAVLINSKAVPAGVSVTTLQKGIAAAADIQSSRGDVLSVSEAPFKAPASPPSATKASIMSSALKPAVALLVVLLIVFLLWRASKKSRRQPVSTDEMISTLALQELAPVHDDMPTADVRPAVTAGPESTIHDIIDEQPDEVATVLRDWLARNGAQPTGARS